MTWVNMFNFKFWPVKKYITEFFSPFGGST